MVFSLKLMKNRGMRFIAMAPPPGRKVGQQLVWLLARVKRRRAMTPAKRPPHELTTAQGQRLRFLS